MNFPVSGLSPISEWERTLVDGQHRLRKPWPSAFHSRESGQPRELSRHDEDFAMLPRIILNAISNVKGRHVKIEQSPLSSSAQIDTEVERVAYFREAAGDDFAKLRSLSRFMSRQEFAKLRTYIDIVEKTKGIGGSIAECGVYFGGGFFNFANALAAFEPYNYPCKVVGFDTFQGNKSMSKRDLNRHHGDFMYKAEVYEDIERAIGIFDSDRPLGHLSKLELVRGDLVETAPAYMDNNPGTMWRVISLSVNLFEPSVAAIEAFWPRLQSGGILVFHSLNYGLGMSAIEAAFDRLQENPPSFQVHDYWPLSYFAVRN